MNIKDILRMGKSPLLYCVYTYLHLICQCSFLFRVLLYKVSDGVVEWTSYIEESSITLLLQFVSVITIKRILFLYSRLWKKIFVWWSAHWCHIGKEWNKSGFIHFSFDSSWMLNYFCFSNLKGKMLEKHIDNN